MFKELGSQGGSFLGRFRRSLQRNRKVVIIQVVNALMAIQDNGTYPVHQFITYAKVPPAGGGTDGMHI